MNKNSFTARRKNNKNNPLISFIVVFHTDQNESNQLGIACLWPPVLPAVRVEE
jgi:hypothetical protein